MPDRRLNGAKNAATQLPSCIGTDMDNDSLAKMQRSDEPDRPIGRHLRLVPPPPRRLVDWEAEGWFHAAERRPPC